MTASSHEFAGTESRSFDTPAGRIMGRVEGDIVRVLGVPYAFAERFEPPREAHRVSSSGEKDSPYFAFQRSPGSPQSSSRVLDALVEGSSDGMTFSENCQALSITIPARLAPDERLPVMVWIHGGANVTGAGDLHIYDPQALVVEQRVIVVSITYRLGLLGFFSDGASVPANLGLLDQIAALRWVQRNIEAFGGARESVTLFGQSSGGYSIAHLMISMGARGLFRRAIMQSAPLGIGRGRSCMLRSMLKVIGPPRRYEPVSELLALQTAAERAAGRFGLSGQLPFGVQYGCAPLPAEAEGENAWREAAREVDILIGWAVDETGLYLPLLPGVHKMTRTPLIGRLLRWAMVRPTTRLIYSREARRFAARHRAAGGSAAVYKLIWAPDGSPVGAAHMTDLPLLLGTRRAWAQTSLVGSSDWEEIDARGRAMRKIWADFARTGRVARDLAAENSKTIQLDLG